MTNWKLMLVSDETRDQTSWTKYMKKTNWTRMMWNHSSGAAAARLVWAAGLLPGWSTGSMAVLNKHCRGSTNCPPNTLMCTVLVPKTQLKNKTKNLGVLAGANNGFPPFCKGNTLGRMSKDSDFLTLMVYRSLLFLKKHTKKTLQQKEYFWSHSWQHRYEALHVQGDDTISASVNYIWFLQQNNQVSRSHGVRTVLTVLKRCLFNSVIVDSLLSCWLIMLKLFKSSFFLFLFDTYQKT